jgi:hypothetical protein
MLTKKQKFQRKTSMNNYQLLNSQAASLLLYQAVLKNPLGRAFLHLIQGLERGGNPSPSILLAYGSWFSQLAHNRQSWQDYLLEQILLDDNPFSRQAQQSTDLPKSLINAAKYDLTILQGFYQLEPQKISRWIEENTGSQTELVAWELENSSSCFLKESDNWADALPALADHYRKNGSGIFARYRAFGWRRRELIGINHPDPITLDEIVGYDSQKELLLKNTESLLRGITALNILLYGGRGTGKSSLIKGLLNGYHSQGLRLVEVGKSQLRDLPKIIEKLRNLPQKFIVFVDDLSFEEDDDSFKALKVVLEGSVTAKAQNVVVYATSNRRHLIKEYFSDRPSPTEGKEVHGWDTMQEKLSFSDRFGLTLTFESPDQEKYLTIVQHLASQEGINLEQEELEFRAKQWATRHNGRSGRTARQFIDFLKGELSRS